MSDKIVCKEAGHASNS